jgi:hypothetical protein
VSLIPSLLPPPPSTLSAEQWRETHADVVRLLRLVVFVLGLVSIVPASGIAVGLANGHLTWSEIVAFVDAQGQAVARGLAWLLGGGVAAGGGIWGIWRGVAFVRATRLQAKSKRPPS